MRFFTTIMEIFCISVFSVNAQTDTTLLNIKAIMSSINTYQCDCKYSNSLIGKSTINQKMTVVRNANDTSCGFYFHFFNDSTFPPLLDNFDFVIYNGTEFYKSYKKKITQITKKDNQEQFLVTHKVDKEGGIMTKPSVLTANFLFQVTLFEIEKEFNKLLLDSATKIQIEKDTVLHNKLCNHYIFNSRYREIHYFFDKKANYPVKYISVKHSPFGSQRVSSDFFNIKINQYIPLEYFSESNLLPNFKPVKKTNDYVNMVGKKAPFWTLPIFNTKDSLSLNKLTGKIILLDFTASWCMPCRYALEMMSRLHVKYLSNQNIVIISAFLDNEEGKQDMNQILHKYNVEDSVLYNATKIMELYKSTGVPAFFIIDKNGQIVEQIKGYSEKTEKKITDKINKLIK